MRVAAVAWLTVTLVGLAVPAGAQPAPVEPVLRIGTYAAPPFAMRDGESWEGISIALLDQVAARAGFHYQLVEVGLTEMIEGPAAGRLDGSIAAVSPTADRERMVDFSTSYFMTGLTAAVPEVRPVSLRSLFGALFSREFRATLGLLLGLTVVAGALTWALERRRNPGEFERGMVPGILSGFWWAAVTMSTVGYGDKTPITFAGRFVAVIWMILTLGLVALATAQLSATLTAERLSGGISSVADLARIRVGVLADGPAIKPLNNLGARIQTYPTIAAGLQAVADGHADAFVHDEPVLAWELGTVGGVRIAPLRFASENYAMVLSEDSPWREKIDQAISDTLASDQWLVTLRYYLGPG